MGKTTLWEAGVEAAAGRGRVVLAARPSGAEAQLAFAALTDLLESVDLARIPALPAPQRNALEAALLRTEPAGPGVEPRSIATGLLTTLRALAEKTPVLLAIDDVQWLDAASADALAFAMRRLDGADVRFLLARRPGRPTVLEAPLRAEGMEQLDVRPLSLGATRALLFDRLGLSPPRRVVRQIFDSAGGNPLFTLEIGRVLVARGIPAIGEELPVPEAIDDLFGARIDDLPPEPRKLLLAVALSPGLQTSQLETLGSRTALEDAVEHGVLTVEEARVRASHPLVAAAARRRSKAREQREVHRELAALASSEAQRARHLALASDHADPELAATIAAAAAEASTRGARAEAVELAEYAVRLTPPDSPEHTDRRLRLARYLEAIGEVRRVTELVGELLDSLPPGRARADAYMMLMGGQVADNAEIRRYLKLALAESEDAPDIRTAALAQLAINDAVILVERIAESHALAEEALATADGAGPEAERFALDALAWTTSLLGQPLDEISRRFAAASDEAIAVVMSPERINAQRMIWRGEFEPARTLLTRLRAEADGQGDPGSYALSRLHLCELALRTAAWDRAEALLDEWAESSEHLLWPMYERCRALLAVGRGLPEDAERWADRALARAAEVGAAWDRLEALRAQGTARLLRGDHAGAADCLGAVWQHLEREGVLDPGAFPVAPELVEALAELGRLDEAVDVTGRLQALSSGGHPWAATSARRCLGVIDLARKEHGSAAEALRAAASEYSELGLRFDAARTLLGLGRGERRLRKWGTARASLEESIAIFEQIGSPGWAELARSELSRVGARRPAPAGELTPTERRIAELAAEGLSNKEIARELVVSIHTVEVHLSHAYAKLGIRSRSQLSGRLAGPKD